MLLLNIGAAQEAIIGHPKIVRVEKEEFSERTTIGKIDRYLCELTEYHEKNQIASRQCFRRDGTLSTREMYEYGEDGRLHVVRLLDQSGNVVGTKEFNTSRNETEESVTRDGEGKELGRIKNTFKNGKLFETQSIDISGSTAELLYDDSGQLTEGNLTFKGGAATTQRVRIKYDNASKEMGITYYGEGDPITVKSQSLSGLKDVSEVSFFQGNEMLHSKMERIDARDERGNWIEKSILERDGSTGASVCIEVLYRTIEYGE